MSLYLLWLFAYGVFTFEFKCPLELHRQMRVNKVCTEKSPGNYSCLLDQHTNTYNESCTEPADFVRPGHKYVIGVYRKNTPCSLWRYQPFKLWSNELSRCVFAKSGCNELGQIMYDIDSASSDNVCRCDHAEGFSFLYVPKNHCYCIPTQEDCTCYKKMSSEDPVLTADYHCNYSLSGNFSDNDDKYVHNMTKTKHKSAPIQGIKSFLNTKAANLLLTLLLVAMIIIVIVMMISLANPNECIKQVQKESIVPLKSRSKHELITINQDNEDNEDRMKNNDDNKKTQHINAVIRIGLSSSEIAFLPNDLQSKNKEPLVMTWESKERGKLEYNSTAILFKPNKTVHSIGFEAEEYFYSKEMNKDRESWFFFTNIMTTLYQKGDIINEKVKKKDEHNINKLKAVDVIFAFINNMQLQLLSKLRQDSSDTIHKIDTLVIILPVVWNFKEKILEMLKASELAGDSDKNIVLEAPKALIRFYSTYMNVLKGNTKCIVLDIGDKSMIATVMAIRGQTYEIETTEVRQSGSVSDFFFAFLTRVFTDRVKQYVMEEHPQQYTETFRNFQVKLKNVRRNKKVNFGIPYIWFEKYNELYGTAISKSSDISITNNTAKISYNQFQEFIEHRYQNVATILTMECVSDVKVILLVGDNIDNMFVTNLREKHHDFKIYSADPKAALLKGAFEYVNQ